MEEMKEERRREEKKEEEEEKKEKEPVTQSPLSRFRVMRRSCRDGGSLSDISV